LLYCFFFSSRRRHTRFSRDWSSDVCSSDLASTARSATRSRSREFGFPEADLSSTIAPTQVVTLPGSGGLRVLSRAAPLEVTQTLWTAGCECTVSPVGTGGLAACLEAPSGPELENGPVTPRSRGSFRAWRHR